MEVLKKLSKEELINELQEVNSRLMKEITEHKQTEKKLLKSISEIESIFHAAPVGIGIVVNRVILKLNETFCDMVGYSEHELIGKDSRIVFPTIEEYENVGKAKYEQIQKYGKGTIETRFLRKDGKILNVLVSSAPIDNQDLAKGVTFTALDFTQCAEAEKELVNQKEYFHTVLSNLHEDIFIIDKNYKILDINHRVVIASGFRKEEIIGKHCYQVSHDFAEPCHKYGEECLLDEVFRDGKSRTCRHIHRTKNQEEDHIDILLSPIKDEEGNVTHVIEAMRDITDLCKTREALELSEEKYRKFFKDDLSGDFILDGQGKLLDCNDSYMNIFDFDSFKDAANHNFLNPAINDRFIDLVKKEGKLENFEVQANKKDGTEITLLENIVAEFNENGQVLFLRGYLIDITIEKNAQKEIKNYQEHLEELVVQRTQKLSNVNKQLKIEVKKRVAAEKDAKAALVKEKGVNELKTRFISTVSHEIRTPLTAIKSSAELLQRYEKKLIPIQKKEQLERIINSVGYLIDLVEDVLIMGRSDSGKIVFSPSKVNLKEFLESVVRKIESVDRNNHVFSLIYKSRKKIVFTDSKLVGIVVSNLVNNAVKFSPPFSKVHIIVSINEKIIIEVIDEGIGVPIEGKEHVFQPFYRAANADKYKGSGLGLSIVHQSVELLNGTIEVQSKINEGSRFTVIIPIDK